jgi:gamma-glutamyl-gamma-aminobutyrate hydrolase PuuD/uncharacterized protein YjbI with pentapeptide repeats
MISQIYQQLDLNKRLDPMLQTVDHLRNQDIQRIANLAIPFLNLYHPTSIAVSLGLGATQVWTLGSQIITDSGQGEWRSMARHSFHLALVVSSIALSILMPVASVVLSSTSQMASSIYQLGCHLRNGKLVEAAKVLTHLANQLIYLASVLYATPELLFASLLAQACIELYRCYQEWQSEGHAPESLASLLMAFLRLYQASVHAQTLHRNYFGHQIGQEDIKVILADIDRQKKEHPERLVDFEKILIDHYYSSKIRHVSFSEETRDLSHLFFQNVSFKDCDFKHVDFTSSLFNRVWTKDCHFSGANFHHVFFNAFEARNCNFMGTSLLGSIWENCNIYSCDMTNVQGENASFGRTYFKETTLNKANFYEASFKKIAFDHCQIGDSNFADTVMQQVKFDHSQLEFTAFNSAVIDHSHFATCQLNETCFFDAQVSQSMIRDSDLTDCLLLNAKDQFQIKGGIPHQMTRPVIGLLWNFKTHGSFTDAIHLSLRDCKALVFRFDYRVKSSDLKNLDREIRQGIEEISKTELKEDRISIPDAVLKDYAEIEIGKIKQQTEKVSSFLNGLVIPGGNDIEPEFYGQKGQEGWEWDFDDHRSIFEFGLISQALGKGIPMQGICRGSQIVNVFLGGTLKQHVDNHLGVIHNLNIKEDCPKQAGKVIREIIGNKTIHGLSMHHQASDKIGQGLHVVIEEEGIPEALVSEDGKIILTQFHPEMYLIEKQLSQYKFSKEEKEKINKDPFMHALFNNSFADGQNFFLHLIQQAGLQQASPAA